MSVDAAARAKTVLATSSHVEVGLLDHRILLRRHALTAHGVVLMSTDDLPARCASRLSAGEEGPLVDLVAVDVSSAARADRLRATVRLVGRVSVWEGTTTVALAEHLSLQDSGVVVAVTPEHLSIEEHIGAAGGEPALSVVDPQDYVRAPVDPLGGWEDGWTAHLDSHHRDAVRQVVSRLTDLADDARVRPVLADRHGLVVQVGDATGTREVRVPFGAEVACGCEAIQALEDLLNEGAVGQGPCLEDGDCRDDRLAHGAVSDRAEHADQTTADRANGDETPRG